MTKTFMHTPAIYILTRSDLSDIELPPAEVIRLVEDAYLCYANGQSRCPTKLMMPLPNEQRDAVSYSMLGYDGALEQVGFKTSYRQGSESAEKYYTTISTTTRPGFPSRSWIAIASAVRGHRPRPRSLPNTAPRRTLDRR